MARRGSVKTSRSGSLGAHSLSMISHHVLVLLRAIEDCVVVVRIRTTGKVGPELPEAIVRNVAVQDGLLPLLQHGRAVRRRAFDTIFLHHDGLAVFGCQCCMIANPLIAPRVRITPANGVHMDRSIVEGG